jgi:hypothetical protein
MLERSNEPERRVELTGCAGNLKDRFGCGCDAQASPHFPRDIKEAGSPRAIRERIVEPA